MIFILISTHSHYTFPFPLLSPSFSTFPRNMIKSVCGNIRKVLKKWLWNVTGPPRNNGQRDGSQDITVGTPSSVLYFKRTQNAHLLCSVILLKLGLSAINVSMFIWKCSAKGWDWDHVQQQGKDETKQATSELIAEATQNTITCSVGIF